MVTCMFCNAFPLCHVNKVHFAFSQQSFSVHIFSKIRETCAWTILLKAFNVPIKTVWITEHFVTQSDWNSKSLRDFKFWFSGSCFFFSPLNYSSFFSAILSCSKFNLKPVCQPSVSYQLSIRFFLLQISVSDETLQEKKCLLVFRRVLNICGHVTSMQYFRGIKDYFVDSYIIISLKTVNSQLLTIHYSSLSVP